MNSEEIAPNERLRRARSLKGWSQTELAEQVGTSFEMVSRWERGITVPGPYYRERLCAALGKSAEELGLNRSVQDSFTPSSPPLVFLTSSHVDAEKSIVTHLRAVFQERKIALWSSRQLSRQGSEYGRKALREVVQAAQVILVLVSPEARSSRHVREALELANRYQRPVCGVWIEGEHWQECLPEGSGELAALIDARGRNDADLLEELASVLERVALSPHDINLLAKTESEAEALLANRPAGVSEMDQSTERVMPTNTDYQRRVSGSTALLLLGLVILVILGGILGSVSILKHFGARATGNATTEPVRGGTWADDYFGPDIDSLIPYGTAGISNLPAMIDQALYLPLFYSDAQGVVQPGAATEVPGLQNGGISADFKTWTFHLRPHLFWSDGQPYDARDVDYSWKTWFNPRFGAPNIGLNTGFNLINSSQVSANHLTITFHLKQAYAPFVSQWVDGLSAPLPAHHFSQIPLEQILKSPDNLDPQVTSGPFTMAQSVPGDHYMLVRNPRYYRADEGLPYLDKVVFRIVADENAVLRDLQAATIDSAWFLDVSRAESYRHLSGYALTAASTSASFAALFFNFHNKVLASHREVRQAIAMAIDHQALIQLARHGFAQPLCTDHGSALHPGYQPDAPCPDFNPAAAKKLLDDNGWVKGPDGVRTKGGQRLEFEYSTVTGYKWFSESEAIVQRDLAAIGIRLDIQNYAASTFFNTFLPQGRASPPTGAVAGRYDIAQFWENIGNDPDDAFLLACNQIPPQGYNIDFYCNPTLDALYRQEQAIADPGVRQQIFDQIHAIYQMEFPFITLYSPLDIGMVRKGTHNDQPGPWGLETINIWEWWCDKGKC